MYPIINSSGNPGLWIALQGGVWGGLLVVTSQLVQRKLEYQADLFAAKMVGKRAYAQTLTRLNELTGGGLEKKAINYPSLRKRIQHVQQVTF